MSINPVSSTNNFQSISGGNPPASFSVLTRQLAQLRQALATEDLPAARKAFVQLQHTLLKMGRIPAYNGRSGYAD